MLTIYLVRHGQKQAISGDPKLTDLGMRQAVQTGKYLSKFPINKVISSPLKRTLETADQIVKVLGLKYTIEKNLLERMDWKDDGVTKKEFLIEWIKATNNRNYVPKYGDSSVNSGRRIEQLVENLLEKDSNVLLVTSGGVIIDYLRNIFGDKKVEKLRKHYDEGEDYQMWNCAINKVVYDKGFVLEMLNYSDHLEEKSE